MEEGKPDRVSQEKPWKSDWDWPITHPTYPWPESNSGHSGVQTREIHHRKVFMLLNGYECDFIISLLGIFNS